MGTSEAHVTMAEIARLANVKLSTVSNWRRRHKSFPRSSQRDGQEVFPAQEVAGWLDTRKIAKNDLKDDEMFGATYGARFSRKNLPISSIPDAGKNEVLRDKEILWKELSRFRGAEDIAAYADLVLSLLYLSVCDRDRWSDIAAADRWKSVQQIELAILKNESALFQLHRSWRSILTDSRGVERLGEVIRIIDRVRRFVDREESRSQRLASDIFEYLLVKFAAAEGKRGVLVVTPPSVIRVLVAVIALKRGESLLDPCLDSGGFLLEAARYIEAHDGRVSDVSFAGQAILERSWCLARMSLALHDVPADLSARPGVALDDDPRKGKRFDAILANPPFNMSDWSLGHSADRRWHFGIPPRSNANFAWLQHIWSSLAEGGRAAVVMANGALSSAQADEARIRAAMVRAGVVEALVALPPQLFATTAIPVTVWLLRRPGDLRNNEILFIDARELGAMISRSQRDLLPDEVHRIATTVTNWRERRDRDEYHDVQGFSASVSTEEVREQDYLLTPGRYVGARNVTYTSEYSIPELRRKLDHLHRRAIEVDDTVDRQLNRIATWIP